MRPSSARDARQRGTAGGDVGARVRNRTGASRVQGGCSTNRAARASGLGLRFVRARGVFTSPSLQRSARSRARARARQGEPTSGIEPDPPVYEAGARPIELHGQVLAVRVHVDGSHRRASKRRAPARADEEAPAEGIEPSNDRLTVGCLTIRLRWNMRSSRTHVLLPSRRVRSLARRNDEAVSAGVRDEPWRQVFRERGPRVRSQFRAQGSNLSFWVQRPVSCQLDDPGAGDGVTPSRREGARHPSPRRRRSSRSGGGRTLTTPGKSRVRFQLRYGPMR
jgi:hypothetical protein